jgi:hypothetical protein
MVKFISSFLTKFKKPTPAELEERTSFCDECGEVCDGECRTRCASMRLEHKRDRSRFGL